MATASSGSRGQSRWSVLLGSKLLFAVAVAHIPSFLADVVVLAARGFHPWEWLGSLLAKQVMLALVLTLPVIALAATLQSFAHVILAVIAVGGLTALASGSAAALYDTRPIVFLAVLAVAAAVIVPLQYARRRTGQSHTIGVAAVVMAELALCYLSPVFLARVRAAVDSGHSDIAFHLRPAPTDLHDRIRRMFRGYVSPGWMEVWLPLTVSGIPEGVGSLYYAPTIDMTSPAGQHYTLHPSYIGPDFMILQIPRHYYESLKNVNVNLKGGVAVILHRAGPSTSIPVLSNRAVAYAGRCSSSLVDRPIYGAAGVGATEGGLRILNVVCESPAGFPLALRARLLPPELSTTIEQLSASYVLWRGSLSPVERVHGLFRVPQDPGALTSAKLEIIPDISPGWEVANLDLRVQLADYAF